MKNHVAVLALLFACGGGTAEPKAAVTVGAVDAGLPAPAPKAPRAKLGIPRDAALVAAVDVSVVMKIPPLVQALSSMAGVEGDLAAAVGLDTSRPAVVVLAAPDAAMQAASEQLQSLAAKGPPSVDVCRDLLGLGMPGFLRVMLPTSNAEALERVVGTALVEHEGWKHVRDGYTQGRVSLVMSEDDAYVAFDVGGQGRESGPLAGMAHADQPVPTLEGRALRATWNAQSLATTGFVTGMVKACGAISGGSIDPQQKLRILSLGLKESSGIFALATFERGDAELTLSPLALTVRAQPSATITLPPASALAPSPSVTLASAKAVMEESAAFLRAWPLPGGDFQSFRHLVRDAGGMALIVALPHLVAMSPLLDIDDHNDPIAGNPLITRHFDRIEAIETPAEVSVGVLPAGTSLAAARCALDESFPRCPAKSQLKLGATIKRVPNAGPDRFVRLVEVKTTEPRPRYVVLSSTDQSAVGSAVTARMEGGLHVDVSTKDLPQSIAAMSPIPIPNMLVGDASVEDGRLVMRLVGK